MALGRYFSCDEGHQDYLIDAVVIEPRLAAGRQADYITTLPLGAIDEKLRLLGAWEANIYY